MYNVRFSHGFSIVVTTSVGSYTQHPSAQDGADEHRKTIGKPLEINLLLVCVYHMAESRSQQEDDNFLQSVVLAVRRMTFIPSVLDPLFTP